MSVKRMPALAALALATAAWASPVHAGVRVGIGIGLPIGYPYPYYGYPVYVQPAPVYVQAAPESPTPQPLPPPSEPADGPLLAGPRPRRRRGLDQRQPDDAARRAAGVRFAGPGPRTRLPVRDPRPLDGGRPRGGSDAHRRRPRQRPGHCGFQPGRSSARPFPRPCPCPCPQVTAVRRNARSPGDCRGFFRWRPEPWGGRQGTAEPSPRPPLQPHRSEPPRAATALCSASR